MKAPRVLVIDDERYMRDMLEMGLAQHGFAVRTAADGAAALESLAAFDPDVVVLDIMMPKIDGMSLIQMIRRTSEVPIVMLSARDEPHDKIAALTAGADDYLGKPFNLGELAARLHSRLRRPMLAQPATLAFADLAMDLAKREVSRGGAPLALTVREFDLLATLLREPGRVFTREQLIDRVWGYEAAVEQSAVDTYISYLRAKIDAPPHEPLIRTIRRVGYTLRDG
jgi:DNA-binding response OmpR family regulator